MGAVAQRVLVLDLARVLEPPQPLDAAVRRTWLRPRRRQESRSSNCSN
jgi:hypothetical protein